MTVRASGTEDVALAAIDADSSLSELEKSRKRQQLVNARILQSMEGETTDEVRR